MVGVTGETGDNVVLHVVMGSTHAHALAPIPLRQVVEHNVPETAKKHGLAKTDHAMVRGLWQFSILYRWFLFAVGQC